VRPGHLTLARAIELWTEAPRRIFGLPEVQLEAGFPADLTLFDPDEAWVVDPAAFRTKGRNTPFTGHRLFGRVHRTVCAGRVTHETAGAASGAPLR
jgi:dihydroorotase